jgi:hypothetical protein
MVALPEPICEEEVVDLWIASHLPVSQEGRWALAVVQRMGWCWIPFSEKGAAESVGENR